MVDLYKLMQEMDDQVDDDEPILRPPFKYLGNKKIFLREILPLLPYRRIWVDVFGGSGVVTLNRRPSKLDVFNDRNSGVAAFFLSMRDHYEELLAFLELMPSSKEIFRDAKKLDDTDTVLRGAKWYYLAQNSYVGKAKTWGRSLTSPNAAIQKYKKDLKLFPVIHNRFRSVQIENVDWTKILADYDSLDTVFYCDPPYINSFTYGFGMSEADHHRLCASIMRLQGFVALSGYDNEIYNSFDWDGKHVFETHNRLVNTKQQDADRSATRLECLWIKE